MYKPRKQQYRVPKFEWAKDSVASYRSDAIIAARELGYDKQCFEELRTATTNNAIANAMSRARHRKEEREG